MPKRKRIYSSYKERLDPSGKIEDQISELFDFVNDPLIDFLDVPQNLIERAKNMPAEYEQAADIEPIAVVLGPLGWCVFNVNALPYREAFALARDGFADEADVVLVNYWNEDDLLRIPELRIRSLYTKSEPPKLEISSARFQLLELAYKLHASEAFEASIPIVLAQIDGICLDVTHKPAKKLFSRKFFQQSNKHLIDNHTLAGHPLGLAALSKLFCQDAPETTLSNDFSRHGVMHGRTLGYGTKSNSTKAFVALHAVLRWSWSQVWNEE